MSALTILRPKWLLTGPSAKTLRHKWAVVIKGKQIAGIAPANEL